MGKAPTDLLLIEAIDAVSRLFGDKTVSRARTRERMEEIETLVESSLAALDEDDDE